MTRPASDAWERLERTVIRCRLCPRLVAHREEVARVKRRQYRDEAYWGRPLPGFGDRHGTPPHRRPGAGRARRQPHRPTVHRRSQRRLPVRGAARHRLRQSADIACIAATVWRCATLHVADLPLRAAGQQAAAR